MRAPVRRALVYEQAVAQRRLAGRHVEADRERRLVARMVVGGHEEVRGVRLPGGRRPVGGDEERRGEEVVGVRLGRLRRVVLHLDDEGEALAQRPPWRYDELVIPVVAGELRRPAVDRHRADRVACEVQIEARKRLRGAREDGGRPRRCPGTEPPSRSAGRGRSAVRRSRRCRASGTGGRRCPGRRARGAPTRSRKPGRRGPRRRTAPQQRCRVVSCRAPYALSHRQRNLVVGRRVPALLSGLW